jgi:hypothetical protein
MPGQVEGPASAHAQIASRLVGACATKRSHSTEVTTGVKHMIESISFSTKFTSFSSIGRALVLALLAVLSAFLSTYASWDSGFLLINGTPILPGIYFGLVLSFGVFCWTRRSRSELFTVLVITTGAWILAHQTGRHVYELIDSELVRIQKQTAPDSTSNVRGLEVNYVIALCGALGGLVGSFVTGAGIAFVSKEFYTRGNWARTTLIGMVAGTLLEFAINPVNMSSHVGTLLLFLVWQSSVAASIGYGLRTRQDQE